MKRFLALLLALALLILPAATANDEKPYIAVFGNYGCDKISGWQHVTPGLMTLSGDWEKLDPFLKEAKKRAGRRPLIVDIEAHGDPVLGMLALQYEAFGNDFLDECSVGYLLKHIDKYFHNKKNVTVTLESCFSPYCYTKTKVMPFYIEDDDIHVDSFYGVPKFPIMGISSPLGPDQSNSNWNNTVLLATLYHSTLYIHDLREDEGKVIKTNEDPAAEALLLLYFKVLNSMYH